MILRVNFRVTFGRGRGTTFELRRRGPRLVWYGACAAARMCHFFTRTVFLSRFGLQKGARMGTVFAVLDAQCEVLCRSYGNRRASAQKQVKPEGKGYQSDKTYD